MDTKDYTTEFRMMHWAGVMRERKESGLSIRAFCKSAGFHENNNYYWQKRLREAACGELARIVNDEKGTEQPVFAKVNLPAPIRPVPETASDIFHGHLSIEVSGVRISASCDYPAEKLTELLRTVMPCC